MSIHNQKNDISEATVLIVDDSRKNRHALSMILKQAGYKIRTASNGSQALESIQTALPDLILLDILMPDMNGYQVCEYLKADEQACDVPIIFISALNETENKIKAFTVGGVDYVTKPFHIEEVLARVKTHVSLRKLQNQLRAQLEEVQIRNKELDSFAHTVAHDLKNPLTSIILSLFAIQRKWRAMSEDNFQNMIDEVILTTKRLVRIIDELLLLSSVRKEQVRTRSLDMMDIVFKSLQSMENIIQEKQVEIILPGSWPPSVGYALWIEEVWANYINNAIKYGGSPPRIELGADYPFPAQSEEDEQLVENIQVRFWIRDNGRGLTPKERKRLFTPFERLDQISVKGYGLGLSIVHRIIEKLGGQVGVESEVGVGSIFWFTLPAVQQSDAAPDKA